LQERKEEKRTKEEKSVKFRLFGTVYGKKLMVFKSVSSFLRIFFFNNFKLSGCPGF